MLDELSKYEDLSDVYVNIVEQSDDGRRFNLGKLTNVGFDLFAKHSSDDQWVHMFHPIDLFPKDGMVQYSLGAKRILSNASPIIRYNAIGNDCYYRSCQYSSLAYRSFNGYTNDMWGWGAEDDEFFARLRLKNIASEIIHLEFNSWSESLQDTEEFPKSPDYLVLERNGYPDHGAKVHAIDSLSVDKMMNDGLINLSYTVLSEKSIGRRIRHIEVML